MTAIRPSPQPSPGPAPTLEPPSGAGPGLAPCIDGGPVDAAVAAIGAGAFALVVDEDAGPSAEGVLVLAAQAMTTERMAFMMRHTSGVIAVPLEGPRLDAPAPALPDRTTPPLARLA